MAETKLDRIERMLIAAPRQLVLAGDIITETGTTSRALRVYICRLRKTWPHGGHIETVRQHQRADKRQLRNAGYRWVSL